MLRQRIRVQLDGLIAVHAVRAVWTALGAVPGIVRADVTMAGAILEIEGPLEREVLEQALAAAGVSIRSIAVEPQGLPIL